MWNTQRKSCLLLEKEKNRNRIKAKSGDHASAEGSEQGLPCSWGKSLQKPGFTRLFFSMGSQAPKGYFLPHSHPAKQHCSWGDPAPNKAGPPCLVYLTPICALFFFSWYLVSVQALTNKVGNGKTQRSRGQSSAGKRLMQVWGQRWRLQGSLKPENFRFYIFQLCIKLT